MRRRVQAEALTAGVTKCAVADAPDFRPDEVVRLLGRHRIAYVLIGGLAAITHGAPLVTQDVDICHGRDEANLRNLAAALDEVHARLRDVDTDVPFRLDATSLGRGDSFTFTTDIGWIDILGTPAGTEGYADLARTADTYKLFGHRVFVASIDDLIRMKRAAGRRKDLLAAEELGALRDELDQRP